MVGERKTQLKCLLDFIFRTCALNTKIIFILAITQIEGIPTSRFAAAAWETQEGTQFPSHLCAHGASFH